MTTTYNPMENAYRNDPRHTHQGGKMAVLLPYYFVGTDNEQDAHKIIVALERCCCFEYEGDKPTCPIHGKMFPHPKPQAGPEWTAAVQAGEEWMCGYCGRTLPTTTENCPSIGTADWFEQIDEIQF